VRTRNTDQHNTPLPENTVGDGRDLGASIKPLIALLQPGHPVTSMDPFQLAVIANYSLKTPEVFPSDHVSCVDELYYIDYREHNTEFGDDPIVRGNLAWNEVGRHMYFNPTLRKITHEVLRKTFGLDDDAEIPTVRGYEASDLVICEEFRTAADDRRGFGL
jgi:hypothetical protein